jgi:integrase
MARGGMRISEVLGLKPNDIDGQKLLLHTPKSGREQEIVSKVILRRADLSITQRYLGKVTDHEAIRWIENLHG